MDELFAKELCALNTRFYDAHAGSFSDMRRSAWPGWGRCLDETGIMRSSRASSCMSCEFATTCEGEAGSVPKAAADACGGDACKTGLPVKVLDIGCGNLRFERYLAQRMSGVDVAAHALDACAELAAEGFMRGVAFERCDVMELLAEGPSAEALACRLGGDAGPFDLAVAFGFMHHIPLPEWRELLIRAMVAAVRPGGFAVVSLWRFMDDADLAARARKTHERALDALGWKGRASQFAPGDHLLGWQNEPQAFRYCHSFSDVEGDEMACAAKAAGACLVARFKADGRTGALNEYLVFKRGI